MLISSAFARDANRIPINQIGLRATKTITYDSATTGAIGTTTLFTVTGLVAVRIFGVVSDTDLTGAGKLAVGMGDIIDNLLPRVSINDLVVGNIWIDNTPNIVGLLPGFSILKPDTNINQTVIEYNIESGTITYYCFWVPLSDDGSVIAA